MFQEPELQAVLHVQEQVAGVLLHQMASKLVNSSQVQQVAQQQVEVVAQVVDWVQSQQEVENSGGEGTYQERWTS